MAVNYMVDQNIGISESRASQLFSYCQITFTVGRYALEPNTSLLTILNCVYLHRFIGVVLLNFLDPALLLSIYGVACSAFALGTAFSPGRAGIGCLFALFFFESICYPVIFTLGTKHLGKHTKRGSGLVVMVRRLSLPLHV